MASESQEQRQRARRQGRYVAMPICPRCKRRGSLEPAYSVRDGGHVPDDSPFAGGVLCPKCINQFKS